MTRYLNPMFAEPHTNWRKLFAFFPTKTNDKGLVWLCFFWERTCVVHEYLPDGGTVYLERLKYIDTLPEVKL